MGDKNGIAGALHNLGQAVLDQGDAAQAGALFAESRRLFHELVDKRGPTAVRAGRAEGAVATDQPPRAARLCGAAEALRRASGLDLYTVDCQA